ncbi:MAG: tagaturonate reductase [Rikenellaceae bacterium]|jgi:tagaturonate reductase|nr:tagaturonate reductase [Rikenellaceae bacterium]
MKALNRKTTPATLYPVRVIQFGEGNFLRAFVDWIIYRMNQDLDFNTGVAAVQPIAQGMAGMLSEQDCLYTLILKGIENGKPTRTATLIDTISEALNPYEQYDRYVELALDPQVRFVISNTTEAGIAFSAEDKIDGRPPVTFPGKLTKLLYERFQKFEGAADKGLIVIPCELIDRNGDNLLRCVEQYTDLWGLGEQFRTWAREACIWCNTLVDRIVPGYPREEIESITAELGYKDNLVVEGEIFHLWVIEAPHQVQKEFPADKAGLNVLFVPSMKPYRDRKVTLLNGPHTVMAPVTYLAGLDTVREGVEDKVVGEYVRRVMFDELLPSLDLPQAELEAFAADVVDRFRNPYVKHYVTSITLNSLSKFKSRDLPAVKIYLDRKGALPRGLVFGLAAIATYYKGGKRGADQIKPADDAPVMDLLAKLWATGDECKVAEGILSADFIWGEDLSKIPGLQELLCKYLKLIAAKGMRQAVQEIDA